MKTKLICLIVVLMGLQSCQTCDVDDYEMNVLNEIFEDLIWGSGAADMLIPPPPPPSSAEIKPVLDEYGNVILSVADICQEHVDREQRIMDRIEKVNKGELTAVIAITDSLFVSDIGIDLEQVKRHYQNNAEFQLSAQYEEAFNMMKDSTITSRFLDLTKIKNKGLFELRYLSEFPEDRNSFWERDNYDFCFLGLMGISRIYFDSSRQFGVIYCYGLCVPHWGGGSLLFIRKIDGKWKIENGMNLWVS